LYYIKEIDFAQINVKNNPTSLGFLTIWVQFFRHRMLFANHGNNYPR